MPRRDRTFNADDFVRIFANNLTISEMEEVLSRLGVDPQREGEVITEPESRFFAGVFDLVLNFIPIADKVFDAGSLLGDLFNQADIEEARLAAAFMQFRIQIAQSINNQFDF